MLEDGQRPGDLSALSGDHAVAVEPATARQIEVVRGPMSLLYGSSALGGVVNVIREEIPASLPDQIHGALLADGASVNRSGTLAGYASTRLGRLAVRGEGSYRDAGETRTPVGRLGNTDGQTVNAAAAVSWAGSVGHVGASYRFYDNEYGIPGGFVGGHETGIDVRMRRHTVKGEAERVKPLGALSMIKVTGSITEYGHEELEPSGAIGTRFDQFQSVGEVVARHGRAGPLASGAFGVRAQYRDIVTGGTLRTPSTGDQTLAGFVIEEIGTGTIRAQAGLRYDYASYTPRRQTYIFVGGERVPVRARTFGAVSGSFGVLADLREVVHLGASVSRAYRTPDFNELYSNGPHLAANSFDVGDPRLTQETGLGAEVFARFDREHVRGELSVFRNQLDQYIFPSSRGRAELGSQGNRPRFQYTNEDAVFVGAEAQVELALTRRLVVDATTSLVNAHFTSERAPIPVITATDTTFVPASGRPPLIPPLNGSVGVRYDRPRSFWGLVMRWADRQDRVGDFETTTAGYALLSANMGWRILAGSRLQTVTLRVDNIFDRLYRDHLSRIKEIMPEPGRNVSLLYRLSF
jgi:iron complex outermembrane receptor protein